MKHKPCMDPACCACNPAARRKVSLIEFGVSLLFLALGAAYLLFRHAALTSK